MKGFDICINDENVKAGLEAGVVVINIDVYNRISVCGVDYSNFASVNWILSKLNPEDKIKVTVLDIDENSPFSVDVIDRQELLKEYKMLKQDLEKEGLL